MTTRLAVLAVVAALTHSLALSQLQAGDEQANPLDGATMVWVPATADVCRGETFLAGSTPAELELLCTLEGWPERWTEVLADTQPAHQVELDGFWLYKHEVTNEQYAAFLAATGREPPQDWDVLKDRPDLPISFVSWDDAAAYARWAGGHLPTETQREYAVRGPEGRLFPWGNRWDPEACVTSEYHSKRPLTREGGWQGWYGSRPEEQCEPGGLLLPVGSLPAGASWCGALDLAGNVWEWCRDWYQEDWYESEIAWDRNPECANPESEKRVIRGGGSVSFAPFCLGAYRRGLAPGTKLHDLGFRLIVEETP